jgi:hypothetical protein
MLTRAAGVSVQEVVRADGKTEAIVDEGIAVASYPLDDVSDALPRFCIRSPPSCIATAPS